VGGLALTILVVLALVRQARRGGEYARLFYLYLLAMGHDTLFVAQLASLNWLCHGLSVNPSGILSDLYFARLEAARAPPRESALRCCGWLFTSSFILLPSSRVSNIDIITSEWRG
jgi:hypothetical protein